MFIQLTEYRKDLEGLNPQAKTVNININHIIFWEKHDQYMIIALRDFGLKYFYTDKGVISFLNAIEGVKK